MYVEKILMYVKTTNPFWLRPVPSVYRRSTVFYDSDGNKIGFIEEHGFSGIGSLKILKLSSNSIQILLGYEFKDLFDKNFKTKIKDNSIKLIPVFEKNIVIINTVRNELKSS
ncbi:hypothetical protein BpHYR1_038660 [Brachionus plicatilis]|uniref:Uncharacterized protein n=1 Tax=Brachionus plicatilis TaxID=10195 RepID=A0A3M7RCT8_BRAPC|nr:hypothetical protein BpHYR1_038660 [Brachionus plicatilis]